jgi:hypothetical protein
MGSKLVGVAVAATVTALGVGTIYLPFIADKDRIRGLHEESDLSGGEKREYERAMAQMRSNMPNQEETAGQTPQSSSPNSNSMWKRLGDKAGQNREK